jgi:hypothetical protein
MPIFESEGGTSVLLATRSWSAAGPHAAQLVSHRVPAAYRPRATIFPRFCFVCLFAVFSLLLRAEFSLSAEHADRSWRELMTGDVPAC